MPENLSGPDHVKRALAIRPELKLRYTSGYADTKIIHDGKIDAGLNLLSKPYRMVELANKLLEVLEA